MVKPLTHNGWKNVGQLWTRGEMIVQVPPYDPRALANRFLALAQRDGEKLDHLKLQKLLYLLHGWSLFFTNNPMLREFVEAWEHGPVVPSVYHSFKQFGNRPITEPAVYVATDPFKGPMLVPFDVQLGPDEEQLMEHVWQTYKPFSGLQLSTLTHEKGMAWDQIKTRYEWARNADIPNELIRDEFKARWEAANARRTA
jgi:uncharacterized phage-associated protein